MFTLLTLSPTRMDWESVYVFICNLHALYMRQANTATLLGHEIHWVIQVCVLNGEHDINLFDSFVAPHNHRKHSGMFQKIWPVWINIRYQAKNTRINFLIWFSNLKYYKYMYCIANAEDPKSLILAACMLYASLIPQNGCLWFDCHEYYPSNYASWKQSKNRFHRFTEKEFWLFFDGFISPKANKLSRQHFEHSSCWVLTEVNITYNTAAQVTITQNRSFDMPTLSTTQN